MSDVTIGNYTELLARIRELEAEVEHLQVMKECADSSANNSHQQMLKEAENRRAAESRLSTLLAAVGPVVERVVACVDLDIPEYRDGSMTQCSFQVGQLRALHAAVEGKGGEKPL